MADQQRAAGPAPEDPAAGPGLSAKPGGPAGSPLGFRRDREYKMIAGVCAGLGRQCDMDPVIFRITLAVLSATGGIGLIFYGLAWLFVPYAQDGENEIRKLLTGRIDGQALTAVLFALVGCGVFLSLLGNGGVLTFGAVLALLLAGAGHWSQHRAAAGPDPVTAPAAPDAPPEAQAPPVPGPYQSWWRDPIVKDGTHTGGTGYLWGPGDSGTPDVTSFVSLDLIGHRPPRRTPPPRPPAPRRLGGWLFLLATAAAAVTTGLTWDTHPLGSSLQAGLAAALIVLGLGIAFSSFLGRTGAGSVLLALVTAALLAATTAVPKNVSTHWADTTWRPTTTAELHPSYTLGTGRGTLDLSALPLAKGTTTVSAEVAVGKLKVIVPATAKVNLDIDVGLGDVQLPGENKKDVDVEPGKHRSLTLTPPSGTTPTATLNLTLQVGVGQAEVTRATP